ncbi:MAG: 30S ribosomal protein S1 [Bryobacteraceae bacterium]|jgi:small subunit ribosomal protein S1
MPNNITLEQDETPTMPERGENFADILSQYEQSHTHKPEAGGQGLTGTVVAVSPEQVFIDIGQKIEGVMPLDAFKDPSGKAAVQVGDHFPVSIKGRNEEGYYELSKVRVERPKDWTSLEAAFNEKRSIAGVVSGVVKGGLSVDVGVRAFMPASRSGAKDVPEMEKLVGQEITCRIIKLDVADEDVVVDRRVVLEEQEALAREKVFTDLQEGAVMHGTVRSLMDYGAFVDIGGIDGLLHVADISWGHVNKPADALAVGQEVDVKILKVDPAKRRVGLGLKQLLPHPWEQVGDKYKTGDRVRGAVTRVTDFGAFVELEPGVEGLIHLSEMSWSKKARKPSDVLKPGDAVEAVVLHVSPGERRISLGLKQALGDPWADAQQKYPVGGVIEGPVVTLTKFGAFVQIAEGVEGMIHVGDITAEKRINHPQDVLRAGQTVRAQILEVDTERRRIRLGMKQLQPTSIDEYIADHKAGDVVTGRIADISGGRAKVELGEGITVPCKVDGAEAGPAEQQAAQSGADVNSLSSMLSAKWKGATGSGARGGKREAARAGQIRSFRIVKLDAAAKKIEIELAG